MAGPPCILVGRDLATPKSTFQKLNGHFLLDGGDVLSQIELPCHVSADCPKAVLTICQADVEAVVDGKENDV